MSSPINGVGGSSSPSHNIDEAGFEELTEETEAKLQEFGIDISNIDSEEEGQMTLRELEYAQSRGNSQQLDCQARQVSGPLDNAMQENVKDLASKVGVSVETNDSVDDILNNISKQITELKNKAEDDPQRLSEIKGYEESYNSLCKEYQQTQSCINMTGASFIANCTKMSLGIN